MSDDEGFTLLELLIAVAVMGFVFVFMAVAFDVGFHSTDESDQRLVESRGAELLSTYLPRDVQSARMVIASPSDGCGAVMTLLTLTPSQVGRPSVSYVTDSVGPSGCRLLRQVGAGTAVVVATELSAVAASCSLTCTSPDQVTVVMTTSSGATFRVHASPRRQL